VNGSVVEEQADTGEIESAINHQRVHYLFEYTYLNLLSIFVALGLIPMVLWETVSGKVLAQWVVFGLVISLVRTGLNIYFNRKKSTLGNVEPWFVIFNVFMVLLGIMFGIAGGLSIISGTYLHAIAIHAIIYAYALAMMTTNVSYLKSSYFFMIPALLPGVMASVYQATIFYYAFAVILLIATVIYFLFVKNFANNFIELITLRYQLSAQKQTAERANMAKSRFLAAASHDLRQPLHALSLFIAVLDGRIKDEENRKIIADVNRSLGALNDLFDALLDISRLDANVIEPHIQNFSLWEIFARLASEYHSEAEAKGLVLRFPDKDIAVYSDPALLELILRNLVSNAIRYTSHGSITVTTAMTDTGKVKLQVADTGIGIPQNCQTEIFQEFYQVDNPERDRTKGIGLGLAIVKRLADLLQHKITVESKPGDGSVFTIALEAGDLEKIPQQQILTPRGPSPLETLQDTNVLLLDDEMAIRDSMSLLLEEKGCHVLAATSCDEVLDKLRQKNFVPDVLIVDYRLQGGKTGIGGIKAITEYFGFDIPALIITGDTAPEILRAAKASGHTLLHKPVQSEDVLLFIRNALLEKEAVL